MFRLGSQFAHFMVPSKIGWEKWKGGEMHETNQIYSYSLK